MNNRLTLKIATIHKSKAAKAFGMLSLILSLAGCPGGGSGGEISGAQGPGSGGGASGSISLTVDSVYPTSSGATWVAITDGTGMYYVAGSSLTMKGTCSRGVGTIQLSESTTQFPTASATCDDTGAWSWTSSFTAGSEANYTITATPVTGDGTVSSSGAVSKVVRVDDAQPATPTITSPSGNNTTYSATGMPSLTISGTISADTVKMLGPSNDDSSVSGTKFTISGTTWSFPVTLSANSTTAYTFYSYDRAGNLSPAATINVNYTPSMIMKIGGAFQGNRNVVDGGTSYSMEASMAPVPKFALDGGTSYKIETGFNRIVNQVRSDP